MNITDVITEDSVLEGVREAGYQDHVWQACAQLRQKGRRRLLRQRCGELVFAESLNEDLKKWFKDKWVRFGPDGKIRGDCARGSDREGKPKCLPRSKAHALGKKGRKSAAARKRRQDPNPERRGKAKNVATKKK
jgi:hypothetical protein